MDNSPMLSTPSLRPHSVTGTYAPVTQRPSRPASPCIITHGRRSQSFISLSACRRQAGKLRGELFRSRGFNHGDTEIAEIYFSFSTFAAKTIHYPCRRKQQQRRREVDYPTRERMKESVGYFRAVVMRQHTGAA